MTVILDIAAPHSAHTGQVSTPRPGKADKTVMGASGTGSYEVTPPRPFACRRRHRSSRPILPRTANIASVSGGSHPASGTAYILILTV
ncbi:MAG: hypothetical protein ACRDSM_08990, partial [Pseudonocardiaceae bacterium]